MKGRESESESETERGGDKREGGMYSENEGERE